MLSKNASFKVKSDLYYRLERLLSKKKMGSLFKVLFADDTLSNACGCAAFNACLPGTSTRTKPAHSADPGDSVLSRTIGCGCPTGARYW